MAKTTAQLLSQLEDTIYELQQALIDTNVEEYRVRGGRGGDRIVRRAEFSRTLEVLYAQRAQLKQQATAETSAGRRVRVAKLGRPRAVDR
jgi:hypothetical protein